MTDLRKLAKGRECFLRLPGCSGDPAKTVLCHISRGGVSGTGLKSADLIALPMDHYCHDVFDGRRKRPEPYTKAMVDMEALRGYVQWIDYLLEHEVVVIV